MASRMKIGFLLPQFMRSIFPTDKEIIQLASEASGGIIHPVFSDVATKWLSPADVYEGAVREAYLQFQKDQDIRYVLVFGDDAAAKLFDLFSKVNDGLVESIPTATVLTGVDVDAIAPMQNGGKHLKFWFTQEYETLVLLDWLLGKKELNGGRSKVCILSLDARAPIEHCAIFRKLICDQYRIYEEIGNGFEWKFDGAIPNFVVKECLQSDAVFISGYADHGHVSLINSLVENHFGGYVFTNVALSIGIDFIQKLPKGPIPFCEQSLFYTGIGLADVRVFYRKLMQTVFGYFAHILQEEGGSWTRSRTYASPFGVLNIGENGNMSLPLALWRISYNEIVGGFETSIAYAQPECFAGFTELAGFLHNLNLRASELIEALHKCDYKNGSANECIGEIFDLASADVKALITHQGRFACGEVSFCVLEGVGGRILSGEDCKKATDGFDWLRVVARNYVVNQKHSDVALQINLTQEDFPDNSTNRLWVGRGDEVLTVVQWLRREQVKLERLLVADTRKILAKNKFTEISSVGVDMDGLRTAFTALSCDVNYVYVIPCAIDGVSAVGLLLLTTEVRLPFFVIQVLSTSVRQLFTVYFNGKQSLALREAGVRSAIGSIMSRNGSHNIGSHVLAALSHNVGTMPDDRVLYQYIQNRMDYIATVTTDPPTWTQPTLLVGNLVRGFLSQYHLLEHIAESEGLGAYVFQSRSGSFDIKKENESGKIELHVRMRRGGVTNELIAYGEDTCPVDLQNDIALAIPGGVVGNHAFYTVLENVIRNAAKHGWSIRPKDERKGNLRIYVEFEEGDEDVEFTVWDNMSDVFAKTTQKNLDKPLVAGEIRDVLDRLAKGDEKALGNRPLHHLQQIKLALPLITERGSLRQENWGLAEMKISVGYLNRRSVSEIGGLDKDVNDCSRPDKRIITPVAVAEDGKADVVHHLGYRFSIPKPKDVVFVLNASDDALWIKEQGTRIDELKRYGIYFCLSDELQQSPSDETQKKRQITSQYVVFRDFKKECLDAGLPFRVLTMQTEQDRFRPDLIPTFTTFDSVKKLVEGAFAPKDKANDIKLLVWGRWIEFLWERRKKEFPTNDGSGELALLINTKGDAAGSGRGLITDTDLLEYVFENCVRSTIRMFKISHAKISTHCLNVLDALYGIDCYKFVRSDDGLGTDIVARISCVLAACLESVSVEREFCRSTIERWRLRYVLKDTDAMSDEEVDQYLEDRDRAFQESSEMDEFVSALRMAYDQADVFLRKYEEDISTLPSGFKVEGDETRRQYFVWPSVAGVSNEFPGVRVCFDPEQVRGYAIEYFRHFDPDKGRVSPLSLYVEPLSGSQCYMNSVNNVNCGKVGQCSDVIVVKLLEAGLMRVVIADERVAKFCRDHVSMRKTYDCLRIGVLDDKDVAFPPSSAEELSEKIDEACHNLSEETRNDLDGKKWDVFIIHQGLIDKWLFKHSTADVERLLECLKKIFPYVVVTTGRGRPANIPASARVIPFSTLENTLFKKYPEKMILVDTIMNALPVGEKKKGASA